MKLIMSTLFLLLLLFMMEGVRGVVVSNCDSSAQWSSRTTINSTNKVEGTGSLQWSHSQLATLTMQGLSSSNSLDLTVGNANTLAFYIYMPAVSNATIMLQLQSDLNVSNGIDYYSFKIALNFEGWKQFVVKFGGFTVNRSPLGWNRITGFTIGTSGWDLVPDSSVVMNLDNITTIYSNPNCNMDDSDLFDSLEYASFPQLASVKSYWQAGDIANAKKSLANYFRTRTNVNWRFNPRVVNRTSVSQSTTKADASVDGTYNIASKTYKFTSGKDVNWTFNPTLNNPDVSYDPEWQWQLNRMDWYSDLGSAWWATNNSIYADTYVAQVKSFYSTQPRPCAATNNAQPSTWRTIECGIRTSGSWTSGFFRFLTAPQFTDEVLVDMVKQYGDHGRHLMDYKTSGNWLTMEMNGLFTIGGIFPEFKAASEWRRYAAQRLYDDMSVQLLSDGAQYELSTGYHQVFLDNVIGLYDDAILFGRINEIPANYLKQLEAAYEYNVKLMQPDGNLPLVNDAWISGVSSRSVTALQYFPNNLLLQYAARRTTAPKPSFTSVFLSSSGKAVMRTGWNTTDNYALLDVGPLGKAHVHQDKLNLVMSVYGRPVLWDGGGGNYEQSKYRTLALSTYNHNTAVVDYLGQALSASSSDEIGAGDPLTPPPVWQTTNEFDYIQGSYIDGYGTSSNKIAEHHREVMLLKGSTGPVVYVVVDRFIPLDTDPHMYTVIWNLKSTNTTYDAKYKAVVTQDPRTPNVAILPLGTSSSTTVSRKSAEKSGILWGYDVSRESPFYNAITTVLHERNSTGPQYFVTLVIPLQTSSSFSANNISYVNQSSLLYSISLNSAEINIQLNSNVTRGGIQANIGDKTYTSSNFATPSTSTSSSSSTSSSPGDSTTSTSTTGGEVSAAYLCNNAFSVATLLLLLILNL